jgi:rubrerythrin
MAKITGAKTAKNLMDAFAGESRAYGKYTLFAAKAKEEGHDLVAAVFEETAKNEIAHAKIWLKLLYGDIPSTYENLKDAADGEKEEWTETYIRMASEARDEGFIDIALLFELVGRIEQNHDARYRKLMDKSNDSTVFNKNEKTVWICCNCGHIIDGEAAPATCPVCVSPQLYFESRTINY